jgi:hypothetical protein
MHFWVKKVGVHVHMDPHIKKVGVRTLRPPRDRRPWSAKMFTSFEYLNNDTTIVPVSTDWSSLNNYDVSVLVFFTVLRIQFYSDMNYISVNYHCLIFDDITYVWTRLFLIIVTYNLIPLLLQLPKNSTPHNQQPVLSVEEPWFS